MVTREDVERAYERIRSHIVETTVTRSSRLSDRCGVDVMMKLENLQITGSFKERGALNKLLSLDEEERRRGVIAASAGNHAQGLACHARRLGIPATIVMPRNTPIVKVTSTQYWGAAVVLEGDSFDEAYEHSLLLAEQEGKTYVHPFEDPLVIAGQGTVAVELMSNSLSKDLDAVVVPIGGGGLISGIALYLKSVRPQVRIIGVETADCASMKQSVEAGSVVMAPGASRIAEGITVKRVGQITLDIVSRYVDEIVTVTDDEIANAVLHLLETEKIVVEGAGAAPVAALINNRVPGVGGAKVVTVVSGGNIDVTLISRIIARGLAFDGRIMQVETRVRDIPGGLEAVLHVFHETGANILEVFHHHYSGGTPIGEINVSFILETKGKEHIKDIEGMMAARGYSVIRSSLLSQ